MEMGSFLICIDPPIPVTRHRARGRLEFVAAPGMKVRERHRKRNSSAEFIGGFRFRLNFGSYDWCY
jgi:hypothetical protein